MSTWRNAGFQEIAGAVVEISDFIFCGYLFFLTRTPTAKAYLESHGQTAVSLRILPTIVLLSGWGISGALFWARQNAMVREVAEGLEAYLADGRRAFPEGLSFSWNDNGEMAPTRITFVVYGDGTLTHMTWTASTNTEKEGARR